MARKRDPLFSRLTLLALLALATDAALAARPADGFADRAGNRLEALIEQPATTAPDADERDASPRYCTADHQWCVRTRADAGDGTAQLEVEHHVAGDAEPRMRFVPLTGLTESGSVRPWPFIVRMAPGIGAPQVPADPAQAQLQNVLVGVLDEATTGYSGGGASASTVRLARIYHQDDGVQVDADVLVLPADGNASILACFSAADTTQRAGACHDEYTFSADVTLDPAGQGMPVLRYRTTATRYPAGVSRREDSLAKPPLRRKDLRTEAVAACSFLRVLHFDGTRYQPDSPLPDCADYTGL